MFGEDKNGKPRSDEPAKPDFRWRKPGKPLNTRQAAFVEEYLKDGSATRAAVAAGYSPKRGKETGCELLRDPRIAAIVLARADELAGNLQATRIEVQALHQENNTAAEAAADQIAVELHGLSGKARALMTLAEGSGDIRTALQGLREISRLLELKAKLAGRIAGTKVEINLSSVNIELLSESDLQEFLERAKDKVARIREREINDLISDDQVERIHQAIVTQMLNCDVGCQLTYQELVDIVRAAKGGKIEAPATPTETVVAPAPEEPTTTPTPAAEPVALVSPAPPAPIFDIRARALARLDDRRRW